MLSRILLFTALFLLFSGSYSHVTKCHRGGYRLGKPYGMIEKWCAIPQRQKARCMKISNRQMHSGDCTTADQCPNPNGCVYDPVEVQEICCCDSDLCITKADLNFPDIEMRRQSLINNGTSIIMSDGFSPIESHNFTESKN